MARTPPLNDILYVYVYVCQIFALLPTFLFVRALFGETPSTRTHEARRDTLVKVSAPSVYSGARGGRSKFFFPAGVDTTISLVSVREALFYTYVSVNKFCLFSHLLLLYVAPPTVHFLVLVHEARTTSQTAIAAVHRACLPPAPYIQHACGWSYCGYHSWFIGDFDRSLDHAMTTSFYHVLSPCCFFFCIYILLCVI